MSVRHSRSNHPFPIANYLSHSLAAAHRNVHQCLNAKLKELGIKVEAWRVLEVLSAEEEYTMGELAEVVLINPPTLTKLVDRMVSDGLVHRQIVQPDHHRVQLALASLGRSQVEKLRKFADAQNDELLKKLGPSKIQLLKEALETLCRTRFSRRSA
ncbi:MAG: winged helix-turn-helix transcriptional regulator [Rhodobacteraceae bacterium]|nr:winged helix-turn-helix transcriptional regulator [Paracoccaceae bacterium]